MVLVQWRWGWSLKPSNSLEELCRGAVNSTVKRRGSSCTVPPLLELARLAWSCLPLPCWPWIAFFYLVFLLSGHWPPNQARKQHGPICPLCWSITLASSLSSVCSLPACSSCLFLLLLLLASQGQSSAGTRTEAWLKSQWQFLVSCWLCYVLLWLIRLLDLIFLSHSVLLRGDSSFAFNSFHHFALLF